MMMMKIMITKACSAVIVCFSCAVVKVRGGQEGSAPPAVGWAPPAKISALAAKNLAWPALHESRCFICFFVIKIYRHSNSQCCSHAFFTP